MRLVISFLALAIIAMVGYLIYINWWPTTHGALVVISDPPGAQVWVDLEPTDVITNGVVLKLARGSHSVTVKLDTLQPDPFAQVVNVRGGQADTIRFQLRTPRGLIVTPPPQQAPTTTDIATLSPESALARMPTAADLRAGIGETKPEPESAFVPSSEPFVTNAEVTPTEPVSEPVVEAPTAPPSSPLVELPRAEVETDNETGTIQVSSSEPGALIYVNDRLLDDRTPANIPMPFGTYVVRVELEGYSVSPDEQSVRIGRVAASTFIHFTLSKAEREIRAISVETAPVEGRIFVDGMFVGEGTVTCERDFGNYMLSFGDVEGWRAPKPIRVTLTPANSNQSITARYTKLYHAFAEVGEGSQVSAEGFGKWSTGIILERGKPQPSDALGSKIKEIPGSKKLGWELAMGDPNRNPTGGDYVIFSFDLPEDVPPDSPLNLRLYLYKSDRKYPFTLAGHSEVVVEVNGRHFLNGFAPRYETYAADLDRYEEWSLTHVLKPGENRIMVYTGDGNTIFNYLWKIEIL